MTTQAEMLTDYALFPPSSEVERRAEGWERRLVLAAPLGSCPPCPQRNLTPASGPSERRARRALVSQAEQDGRQSLNSGRGWAPRVASSWQLTARTATGLRTEAAVSKRSKFKAKMRRDLEAVAC